MKKCIYMSVLFVVAAVMANAFPNTVPYIETFESYAAGLEIPGTNGWSAANPGDAVVAGDTTVLNYSGKNVVGYPGGVTNHLQILELSGTVTNDFSMEAGQTVWVDMMVKAVPLSSADAGTPDTANAAIYFNHAGHPMVYHLDVAAGTNRWTEIPEATGLGGRAWVRATIGLDYQSDYFQIKMDGVLLTNALAWTSHDGSGSPGGSWFAMPAGAERMSQLVFDGEALDDLVVTLASPFAAVIKSFERFSGDVYRMVFDVPNEYVLSASKPLKRTDLILGSWSTVQHSTNGVAPWYTTNLTYSATSGVGRVIYLQSSDAASFFGLGE